MSEEKDSQPILSADTLRSERLPPGQVETHKWPVLHLGSVPTFDPATWNLTLFPIPFVNKIVRLNFADLEKLPRVKVFADMHCVTRWSKLNNLWEGIPTRALLEHVQVKAEAKFVMVHCDYGHTTNLPLADFFAEDALLATHHNGEALTPNHGYPLRLVIPRLYAWKSAKWVRGIEFMIEDRPGTWESHANGGYHMRGDPWDEERFRV